jgi:hypothetical protein
MEKDIEALLTILDNIHTNNATPDICEILSAGGQSCHCNCVSCGDCPFDSQNKLGQFLVDINNKAE